MKLKVRYDNAYQTLELNAEETEGLWISLSLEGDGLSQEDREKLIQDEWEERFNKPDYNSWHRFDRHRGDSKAQPGKDDDEEDVDPSEPLMTEVIDDRIFRRDEIERDRSDEYDAVCQWVREVLAKSPKWAAAFIAVRLGGMTVNDYAASVGVKDASTVSRWLAMAEKKLKENFQKRQI